MKSNKEIIDEAHRLVWNNRAILMPTSTGVTEKALQIQKEDILNEIEKLDINAFLDSDKINDLFKTDYSENELLDYFKEELKQKLEEKTNGTK